MIYVKYLCVLSCYLSPVVGICYVICLCVKSCYLGHVVKNDICYMFVCVVLLSQPSSRDLLSVKCLCVLSCYLRHVVKNDICYMCVCVVLLSQPSSWEWYLLSVKCLCALFCYHSPGVEMGGGGGVGTKINGIVPPGLPDPHPKRT